MIENELLKRPGKWVSCRDLALAVFGDATQEHLIGSIVAAHPNIFVFFNDRVVKLTDEALQRLAKQRHQAASDGHPYNQAAEALRTYLSQLRPYKLRIVDILPGRQILERYVHGLVVDISDDVFKLTDDTPVELVQENGSRNAGQVVGTSRDEAIIYVALRYEAKSIDLPAMLEVNKAKPVADLATRLSQLGAVPPLWSLLNASADHTGLGRENSSHLAEDLLGLSGEWVRFLWGPPGAGKTHCIGALTSSLLQRNSNHRALIVAPSNVAVDAAILELVSALENNSLGRTFVSSRKIFRYGYPRSEAVLRRSDLFGPEELKRISEQIFETYKALRLATAKKLSDEKVATLRATVLQLQEARKKAVANYLSNANVIATTISSVFTGSNPVADLPSWDTVILDEASMVNGATILFLASLACKHLLIAGDPRQLAPIFEWTRNSMPSESLTQWLARDPYEVGGLATGDMWNKIVKTNDNRMARILSQRRCHSRIWELTARLYPAVNSYVDDEQLNKISALPPLSGEATVILDLSSGRTTNQISSSESAPTIAVNFESACRPAGSSWENPPTAMLAVDLSREIRADNPNCTIAIITPYRGQVRLIRTWLRGESELDPKLQGVEVGTVHSFQGGESDVVIFDIVDGPPRPNLGALLRDETGMRLVNVALTRARGKLVVIAHKDWMRGVDPARAGLLWHLLFGGAAPKLCSVLPPPYSTDHESQDDAHSGQTESPIEELLLAELSLRKSSLPKFILQHRIYDENGRIVSRSDFAFVQEKLAIYCDGAMYHLQRNQWERDMRQRRELTRLGWKHLAFSGAEIMGNVAQCVDEIERIIDDLRDQQRSD
jgi:very-short-patch-repair endonuclease